VKEHSSIKNEEIRKKYELSLVLLGQKEEELNNLKENVADFKKSYQLQILSLLNELEKFKK
jgi:hypothetical protein